MTEGYTFIDQDLEDRFHRWFVRYNPLYFASALLVLLGVYLVGLGLQDIGRADARVELTWVIEIYQVLLIAAAALLMRGANQRRPAVILGMLAALFLIDPTFQNEVLALYEKRFAAIAWGLWSVVKLLALTWALRLKAPDKLFPRVAAFLSPALTLAVIPIGAQWMDMAERRADNHLVVAWLAALAFVFLFKTQFLLKFDGELDDWGKTVLQRCLEVIAQVWFVLGIAHLLSWAFIHETGFQQELFVPFLLMAAVLAKKQETVWVGAILAVLASLGLQPSVMWVALAVAVLLGWRGWREKRSLYYVGAVVAFHLAIRTVGWSEGGLPDASLWLTVLTALALVALAWRFRQPLALAPALVEGKAFAEWIAEQGALGWGVLSLLVGFLLLGLGVWYNWTHRSR